MPRLVRLCVVLVAAFGIGTLFLRAQEATAEATAAVLETQTYIVRTGDTLLNIAQRFNTSASELAQINNITNANTILLGQSLQVPVLPTPAIAIATTTYTVQSGDTLYRIATRFNTTVQSILSLNPQINPNILSVGQELVLAAPVGATLTPPPLATFPATPAATGAATLAPLTNTPTSAPATLSSAETTSERTLPADFPLAKGIDIFTAGQSAGDIVQIVEQLDVTWVRIAVNWRDVELLEGTLNLEPIDKVVNTFAERGINILMTVTSAPDWARPSATPFVLSLAQYGPPDDPATFAAFAGAVATRYAGKVQAYEIWSEPNLRRSWIDASTTSVDDARLSPLSYLDLLRLASEAIRAADPSALVISAGLAPTGLTSIQNAYSDRLFLRELLQGGVLAYIDGVGVEPDGFANPPDARCCTPAEGVLTHFEQSEFYFYETLNDYHALLVEFGVADVPLWATRFGWGTAAGNTLVAPNMDENPFLTYTDAQEQAAYTLRAFALADELGYVGAMFLYNLNGCVVGTPEGCFYSVIASDGSVRPVAAALLVNP